MLIKVVVINFRTKLIFKCILLRGFCIGTRNIFRSQFLLDSYFNGNFFPHIWILLAAWSLKSWSYSKFMIFQHARIGKVSQIILNYQERILHFWNFFSKPDILPWKIEGTGGIFLFTVHEEEIQENFVFRHFKEDSEIFRPLIFSLFPENDGSGFFEIFWVFEEVVMEKQGQSCSSSKKVCKGDDHLLFGNQMNFT